MSVRIEAKKLQGQDDASFADLSNGTWQQMTERTPTAPTWNGCHDGEEYTPNQLREIAKHNPEHSGWLIELADKWDGAVLW